MRLRVIGRGDTLGRTILDTVAARDCVWHDNKVIPNPITNEVDRYLDVTFTTPLSRDEVLSGLARMGRDDWTWTLL